jgi:hypothetical protein
VVFSFLICWMTGNHLKEGPRGMLPPLVSSAARFWFQIYKVLPFSGRHAPSSLARRCLLVLPPRRNGRNDRRSPARGSHVPGCFLSSASRESYAPSRLACLVVPVCWGVTGLGRVRLDGGACGTRADADGSSSDGCFCLGGFVVFSDCT